MMFCLTWSHISTDSNLWKSFFSFFFFLVWRKILDPSVILFLLASVKAISMVVGVRPFHINLGGTQIMTHM